MAEYTSVSPDGPILSKHKVTQSMLLSCLKGSVSDDEYELSRVRGIKVTNGLVLELYYFMNKHPCCTFDTLRTWLCIFLGDQCSAESLPSVKALRQSVIRLSEKLARLKKQPNWNAQAFSDELYCLPKVREKVSVNDIPHSAFESSSYVSSSSTYGCCSSCDCDTDKEVLVEVNKQLCKELSDLNLKCASVSMLEKKLAYSRNQMYNQHRNDMKKLKRRNIQIEECKKLTKTSKKTLSQMEMQLAQKDCKITELRRNIDCIRHRADYWKSKCDSIKLMKEEEIVEVSSNMHDIRTKLCDDIEQLEEKNSELEEQVQQFMEDKSIVAFEAGKYRDNIRACCYELLSLNVGIRNVEPVIRTVLENIARKSVDRLPSTTTLCNMMVECLTLAQAQLGEQLTKDGADYHTLQTDGTTKYGVHFGTFDVATDDTSYCLGLRQVFSGSAQNTLDTLLEILDDLDTVSNTLGSSKVSGKILVKLKNTMSDRHSAEKLFSQMLCDYRKDILPEVISEWDALTAQEREHLNRMNNFFCALHFIVGLADAAEATLKVWESTFVDLPTTSGNSSGTQRLVRTACKAFHCRGSEQAGCAVHFNSYLRSIKVKKIPLAAFRGNRFNILFYDAAGVYFLKCHMEKYLTTYHKGPLNKLLQAVLADLQVPHYIAGCKALGLVDKLITGPFWRLVESSQNSILEMSFVYSKMKTQLDDWGDDALPLMEKSCLLFPEFTNDTDEVAVYLDSPSEIDSLVQELLQLLCKSFSGTMQRMVIDHLPGGQFHSVSDPRVVCETKSVPLTNVAPERDFAVLDRLLSQKPNATYIALESLLLFSHNQTAAWLDSKTYQEKERLFQAARTLTSVHRANFLKRRQEIERRRKEEQEKREKERLKRELQEVKEKEDLTKRISQVGLWTSEAEVEIGLGGVKSATKKKEVLKLQLRFRKKVLSQKYHDKSVFQFSSNGRAYSVTELKQNLLKLLPTNESLQMLHLDEVANDPEVLLYRRIEHQFNCDGSLVWFKGTVIGFNHQTQLFRVVYDDEDEECQFPLLEDLANNELRVLPC